MINLGKVVDTQYPTLPRKRETLGYYQLLTE